jgi:hypothetical protein
MKSEYVRTEHDSIAVNFFVRVTPNDLFHSTLQFLFLIFAVLLCYDIAPLYISACLPNQRRIYAYS